MKFSNLEGQRMGAKKTQKKLPAINPFAAGAGHMGAKGKWAEVCDER